MSDIAIVSQDFSELIAAAKAGECEILLEEREKRFDCVLFEYSTHTRRITITRTAEPPT